LPGVPEPVAILPPHVTSEEAGPASDEVTTTAEVATATATIADSAPRLASRDTVGPSFSVRAGWDASKRNPHRRTNLGGCLRP